MLWKHKYIEKISKETNTNIFRSLEIEQYLQKTLRDNGFDLQNYQINFLNSIVHIVLSVCKIRQNKTTFIKKTKIIKKLENIHLKQKFFKKLSAKKRYIPTFKFCKNYRLQMQENKLKTLTLNSLSDKILKNLKLFTKNKQNIYVTMKEINYVNDNKNAKQILKTLYKFEKAPFFKDGTKILIPLVTHSNSAELFGKFMANHLKIVKQQNFFLNFLKESLRLFIFQKFSKLQGIKIVLNGRINNSDRSRNYKIKVGKITLISQDSKINYAESTTYTQNGTIGIKIWTSQKQKIN
jgi:Ribosomal protein S3, C-terminal domain